MNKLTEALRRKYGNNRNAALAALGFDESILDDQPIIRHEKEHTMAKTRYTLTKGDVVQHYVFRKDAMDAARKYGGRVRLAYDAEPNEQFKREQYNQGPEGEDDTPHTDVHPELAEFLRSKGFSDEEIEAACQAASEDKAMAADDPTDLAHGAEPRPGGSMTDLRRDGNANTTRELTYRNSREAMDAASYAERWPSAARIGLDNSIPSQHFTTPTCDSRLAADSSPRARKVEAQLRKSSAELAEIRTSTRVQADYAARFPGAAKIGFA
jgi:hypothetical protein